jgi:hypothetical protein
MLRVLMVSLVLALVVFLAGPASGQMVFEPVPLTVSPRWAPVPSASGVQYAPNLTVDVFRYGGSYYCYYQNVWYLGRTYAGPWLQVERIPRVFYQINAGYFRTPPGWARGRKTGWRGEPMPPGQMKKFEGEHIPPGQMRKYEGAEHIPPGQMKKYR